MKKLSLLMLMIIFFSVQANAAERLYLDAYSTYFGEKLDYELYEFRSNDEAKRTIERVMEYAGLEPGRIKILASNIENAAAGIRRNERLILYRPEFMLEIEEKTNSEWAALSIIAHEVGHHLQGHSLLPGGSQPDQELEADQFSGHLLYRMGAPLDEAQIAMELFGSKHESDTHPAKSARLTAIAVGWDIARGQDRGRSSSPVSQSTPEVVVRQFMNAILNEDCRQLWALIHPDMHDLFREEVEKEGMSLGEMQELMCHGVFSEAMEDGIRQKEIEVLAAQIKGDTANVVMSVDGNEEDVLLRSDGRKWFIYFPE